MKNALDAGSPHSLLAYEPQARQLFVLQAENHQKQGIPGCIPLLVLDVWEHAYYIDYKNDRASYLDKIVKFNLNWDFAKGNIIFKKAE